MNDDAYMETATSFHERRDDALRDMVGSFLAHGRKRSKWRASWSPVNGDTLARIWLVYGKRGTIFDSEGLARIAEQILNLIARLDVANAVSGHDTYDMRPEAEDQAGRSFTDSQWERFIDGMETQDGTWLVSDYGLKPLVALFGKLYQAKTDEDRLMTIDRVLNVVHARGDLAALFVTGGKDTLTRIATQGGYSTPFQDHADQIAQQHTYAL